jgi:two-component system CheB/CheR fusion protein
MTDPDDGKPSHPRPPHESLLVIGVGASAGGIAALKTFFQHVPMDLSAAYVVILHLSPDFESHLAEVLQSATVMPVTQVRDRVHLEPNHVYVIPPNGNLVMSDNQVVVTDVTGLPQRRSPVDVFFAALAESHESRAVAVVLSGTGPNGSNGIKRVKERGGLTIVQDPDEAEYGDMPLNSIASGVDFVLRVAAIPAAIAEYEQRRRTGRIGEGPGAHLDAIGAALHDVVSLLRSRTGHDFANYKTATVIRRIERRMAVRKRATLAEYAEFLRENPEEPALLLKDLLISVTNFFRDAPAYESLAARVVPRLFQDKRSENQVRVWVAGCATGEEAYSIAMLLAEQGSEQADPPKIQVFATDLDVQALAVAREGKYSDVEVAEVSEERLRRFFQPARGGHRVGRELREMVLFAHHNVIRDPPFSHLDLIACRNLLIYLNRGAQERAIETFHFALRPAGFLSSAARRPSRLPASYSCRSTSRPISSRRAGSAADRSCGPARRRLAMPISARRSGPPKRAPPSASCRRSCTSDCSTATARRRWW